MTEKYSTGDWMYDNKNPFKGYFWKITDTSQRLGFKDEYGIPKRVSTVYGVAFMSVQSDKINFRHWGDLGMVVEHELRPVTRPQDILLCLASDLQEKHDKISREAEKIKEDITTSISARQLYLEYIRKVGLKTEAAQKEVVGTFETDLDKHGFVRVTLNVKE
jgi:hypothetical protein